MVTSTRGVAGPTVGAAWILADCESSGDQSPRPGRKAVLLQGSPQDGTEPPRVQEAHLSGRTRFRGAGLQGVRTRPSAA